MREETEYRPKPMVELMGQPLIFHIMSHLSSHGIKDFVVAAGYKANMIRDYFANFHEQFMPLNVKTKDGKVQSSVAVPDWNVTVVDTGLDAETSDRLLALEPYLQGEDFLVTYGDGITDANVGDERIFHFEHGKLATVVATRPTSRFGILEISEGVGLVSRFREKPRMEDWVSSGLFMFKYQVVGLLEPGTMFEQSLLPKLASSGELMAFKHHGLWEPVDTFRELRGLQDRAKRGELKFLQDLVPGPLNRGLDES